MTAQPSFAPELQRRTMRKVSWQLLPLVVASYLVAYIDRSNIAFAALTMNRDLGFSAYVYGWGAGIFFLGYALFEVPSNMVLQRTGARRWIARIMITWGILSGLTAVVQGPISFLTVRFLLGVAEAGFFPGIIYYLTRWYPSEYRARAIATLYLAVPVSNGLASIVSAAILKLDGVLNLHGWQWIFIIEAMPAVVLGFVVLRRMIERPADATWLETEERAWLESELRAEQAQLERLGRPDLWQALFDPRTLLLSAIYFTAVTASYGLVFFMPQIVKGLGISTTATGLVSSIPYIFGTLALVLWGYSSDRRRERRWHLIAASALLAVGLFAAGWASHSYWAIVAMSVAAAGIYGSRPAFWPMPSAYLNGASAAAGLAFINSIGNLGGYVGPFIVGWIKDTTQSFELPLYFLGACGLLSGLIALFAARSTGNAIAPARQAPILPGDFPEEAARAGRP